MLLAVRGDRRAHAVPLARAPARDARPARGVPPRRRRRRSCAAMRAARRRTRASAATAASASPSCSRSRGASARRGSRPGHYARIVERDGRTLLARAADPAKDQSYMLARLDPRRLARVVVPARRRRRSTETRAEAAAAGLAAAGRAESQEACFLAGGDYRSFLERHGLAAAPGALVDEAGAELGVHDGYWRFTPGQRRGLGVAAARAALRARDATRATNTVVVGPRASLARRTVTVRGRLFAPADARRGEAALPLAGGGARASSRPRPASACASTSPRTASRAARRPFCTTATWSSVPGWSRPRAPTRLARRGDRFLVRRSRRSRARSVPRRGRCRPRLGVSAAGRNVSTGFLR